MRELKNLPAIMCVGCGIALATLGIAQEDNDKEPATPKETIEDTFRVSKIGKDDEKRYQAYLFYLECRKQHARSFKRKQALGLRGTERIKIVRHLEGQTYLASRGGKMVALEVPKGTKYADNARTEPLKVSTGGKHTYIPLLSDVKKLKKAHKSTEEDDLTEAPGAASFFGITLDDNGAKTTKPKPKPKEEAKPDKKFPPRELPKFVGKTPSNVKGTAELSTDLWVAELKKGASYDMTAEETRGCPTCRGFGQVDDRRKTGRNPSGKMTCPTCEGDGETDVIVKYKLLWK